LQLQLQAKPVAVSSPPSLSQGLSPADSEVRIAALKKNASSKFSSGDSQGALQEIEKILTIDPNNATALYTKAIAKEDGGKSDEALNIIKGALTLPSLPNREEFLLLRAQIYQEDNPRQSIQECTDILRTNPRCAMAYIIRSGAKDAINDNNGSKQDYKTALKIDPNIWKKLQLPCMVRSMYEQNEYESSQGHSARKKDDCSIQ